MNLYAPLFVSCAIAVAIKLFNISSPACGMRASESIFKFTLSKVMYRKMNYLVCWQTIRLCWMLQLILLKIIGCNRRQLRCTTKEKKTTRKNGEKLFQFNCFVYWFFIISNFVLLLFCRKSSQMNRKSNAWEKEKNSKTNIIANESASKHLYFNLRKQSNSNIENFCIIEAAFAKWFMTANKYFSFVKKFARCFRFRLVGIKIGNEIFNKQDAREATKNHIIPQLLRALDCWWLNFVFVPENVSIRHLEMVLENRYLKILLRSFCRILLIF